MLSVITEIVRNVAILTLLTLFLELLLPDGQLSRFVQMFMGLLLLAAVLNPVLGLLNLGELLNPVLAQVDPRQTAALVQEGEELAQDLRQAVGEEYIQGLSKQMEALLCFFPEIESAEAKIILGEEGVISGVFLKLLVPSEPIPEAEDLVALREKAVTAISNFYSLDPEIIKSEIYTSD